VKEPENVEQFAKVLDQELGKINNYYYDERHDTKVIGMPIVHAVPQ
jgi:hypothetical protein